MKKVHYETDNLALCPYLAMNGLKFEVIRKDSENGKYIFVFEDDKQQGTDLAMAFLKSNEGMYKKFWSFFRNELAKAQDKKYPREEDFEPLNK